MPQQPAKDGAGDGAQEAPGQDWQGRQASERAAHQQQGDQGGGYSGSLLNRDQLVHEASVYARNYYLRKKPDEDTEGFDLVEIFQIIPYVFEEEYPPKTLSRASYFGWDSGIARLFNRRFLPPRYQIAMDGIDHALEEGMIQAQHEHVWAYRLKVKVPPLGPPLVLMSDRVGLSRKNAERYAEFLLGERGKDAFGASPELKVELKSLQNDFARTVKKINKYKGRIKAIDEKTLELKRDDEHSGEELMNLLNKWGRRRERYKEKVSDLQDDLESIKIELQDVKERYEEATA